MNTYFIATHHLAKFNGRRACGFTDITYLTFNVTLQNHVVKVSCDFIEGNFTIYFSNDFK